MGTTSQGIFYPDPSSSVRLWELGKQQADTTEAAIGAKRVGYSNRVAVASLPANTHGKIPIGTASNSYWTVAGTTDGTVVTAGMYAISARVSGISPGAFSLMTCIVTPARNDWDGRIFSAPSGQDWDGFTRSTASWIGPLSAGEGFSIYRANLDGTARGISVDYTIAYLGRT